MVTKTIEEARANFENSLGYIPDRYKKGIQKADWHTNAVSDQAEQNYADAVSKAISSKRRQKKIAGVSNEVWRTAAIVKGAPIIGERIRINLDKWATNFGPIYASVQSKVATLPPRVADFRANITNRLVPVVEEWKRAAGKL